MRRPRCPLCGLAFSGPLDRHQRRPKCSDVATARQTAKARKRARLQARVDRIRARAVGRIARQDLVITQQPARYPKTRLMISNVYANDKRVVRNYDRFVPRWQHDLVKMLDRLRVTLRTSVNPDVTPANAETFDLPDRAFRLVVGKFKRTPRLRAEFESVRLLGDSEAMALLLLERVPHLSGVLLV